MKELIFTNVLKTFEALNVKASSNDVIIPEHTAHVFSSFMYAYDKAKASSINSIHNDEEGDNYTKYNLPDTKKDYFLRFGWSYTSMYAITQNEMRKNLQISIHLSSRWFFWRHFNPSTYNNLKKITLDNLHVKSLDFMLNEHNILVAIARILTAKDFQFISTLKPWQEVIYTNTLQYWKIPELCSETLLTFETVKDVIERKMEQYNQKIQRKQSSILFLIALIQTFAIIGYLGDYLNVISINILPNELHFFDYEVFKKVAIFIPLILLSIFAIITIYITDYKINFLGKSKKK